MCESCKVCHLLQIIVANGRPDAYGMHKHNHSQLQTN